ncbi:MAG: hypothetical protein H6659_07685 [Ardenticatenaceae bacterium]|nr:hypothetical protein [Ardenticatenaceae bacterium]
MRPCSKRPLPTHPKQKAAPRRVGATVLPDGLTAQIGPAGVSERRGAAVGVTAVLGGGFRVYLPVVER